MPTGRRESPMDSPIILAEIAQKRKLRALVLLETGQVSSNGQDGQYYARSQSGNGTYIALHRRVTGGAVPSTGFRLRTESAEVTSVCDCPEVMLRPVSAILVLQPLFFPSVPPYSFPIRRGIFFFKCRRSNTRRTPQAGLQRSKVLIHELERCSFERETSCLLSERIVSGNWI